MLRAESSKEAVGERSDSSDSVSSTTCKSSFGELGVVLVLNNVAGVEFGGALYGVARELAEVELCGSATPTMVGATRMGLVGVRGVSGTSIMGSVCTLVGWTLAVVADA